MKIEKMLLFGLAAVLLLAGCSSINTPAVTTEQTQPTTSAVSETVTVPTATEPETEPETEPPTEALTSQGRQFAPDFTVIDVNGQPVCLSQLRGKPVILCFWSYSCPDSLSQMTAYEMLYDYYGGQVQIMLVHIANELEDVRTDAMQVIDEGGHTFPVYFDMTTEATVVYGVENTPVSYFIDEEGGAVVSYGGPISYETLKAGLDLLLGTSDGEMD